MAHYNIKAEAGWGDSDHAYGMYSTMLGVRGVSRSHALDKAIKQIVQWPCVKDRNDAGIRVRASATIIDGAPEEDPRGGG